MIVCHVLPSLAKAGAGCISVQVRICAGGTGKPVFLPRPCFIMIERLWRSVQYEEIYLKDYASVREQTIVKKYFELDNHERPHQSFDGSTPAEVYHGRQKNYR